MSTWGRARIEVIAMRDHILHELRRGVPMKQIFDALAGAGQVSIGQITCSLAHEQL